MQQNRQLVGTNGIPKPEFLRCAIKFWQGGTMTEPSKSRFQPKMPFPAVANSMLCPENIAAVPPAVSVVVPAGQNLILEALPPPRSAFFGVPSLNADNGAAVPIA